jgi:lipopolysaccharide transport system ATP-binding protein
MSSEDIAIRVSNLSKRYEIYGAPRDRLKQFVLPRLQQLIGQAPKQYFNEFWALKDVSFEIKKGETVGIIGRNGSGKSTLLQMICGTLTPSIGSIQTNGRIAALLELGSGFNPEFTGRENVYLNASVLGLSTEEIDARFDDIASFADIGQFIEQPVKTYSSGMYVRLAFAVIVNVDADILVVDEALSVGDAFFSQKCMRFLHKFMEDGTVIFVSHDTGAVLNLCNKAVWLNRGEVKLVGLPKVVTENYLQQLYEEQQEGKGRGPDKSEPPLFGFDETVLRDMRENFINNSSLRNDIQIFAFSKNSPNFGIGGVEIVQVLLTDQEGVSLSWVVGGERVCIFVVCKAKETIYSPIVGFMVKDRLGQVVFADNTFLVYMHKPLNIEAGETIKARFCFSMPVMPVGDYTITVAIAEGTQLEHVQHQWIHDALAFKVHSSSVCHGLIGVPMNFIEMSKE